MQQNSPASWLDNNQPKTSNPCTTCLAARLTFRTSRAITKTSACSRSCPGGTRRPSRRAGGGDDLTQAVGPPRTASGRGQTSGLSVLSGQQDATRSLHANGTLYSGRRRPGAPAEPSCRCRPLAQTRSSGRVGVGPAVPRAEFTFKPRREAALTAPPPNPLTPPPRPQSGGGA